MADRIASSSKGPPAILRAAFSVSPPVCSLVMLQQVSKLTVFA
jgi:hypothetical protein